MKKYFFLKIFLLVAVLFFLILRAVPYFINLYLNANAEEIVSDMITRTNDFGGHEVHFGEIIVNYDYRGTFLQLSDVRINPGNNDIAKNQIQFNLTFDQASLTGFSWTDFLFDNSITLDSAVIDNINIPRMTPPLDSLVQNKETRTEKGGKDYDLVAVKRIRVNQMSFENHDSYSDSTRLSIKDLFVFGEDFLLTKEDLEDPDALFKVTSIEGYLDQAVVHFNEFRNSISANDLAFNTLDEKVSVGLIKMDNKLDPYEYSNQFKVETDWVELEEASILFEGMDFTSFFREGSIKADKLHVEDMKLVVFRDKRKPEELEKRPKMIHEILRELPLQLDIEDVALTNGYVSYEERPENKSPRSGNIYFNEINATIKGVTNSPERLSQSDEMLLQAKAKLIDEGIINLKVTYFLSDTTGKFLMSGSIGAFNLLSLNQMIEPSAKIAIINGRVNSLFFDIAADDLDGTGEVIVRYQDLEIEILDKNYGRNQNLLQKIGSFLANKLIIKSQNPDKKGELKKGAVYYPRDQHKFIFKYWWELVLSGLKSTLTGDTEEDLRKKANNS